jgi:threonine dehydrogenase-like Zn-dependent dehydrogenase
MHALILERPGRLRAAMMPPPATDLPPGMARVDVRRVGVCGTDFHAWRGRQPFFTYPRILGHELGVVVAAVGDGVSHVAAGDRCAVEPYLFCGTCDACRRGRGNCCERLQVLGVHIDGGMREQLVVPADRLHPSASLDLDQLALVETLSIGAHAVRRAAIAAGEPVLVIGAGPIGLSAAAFAQLSGGRVVMLDVSESRLRFAREWLGVEPVSPGGRDDSATAAPGGRDFSPAAGDLTVGAPADKRLEQTIRTQFAGDLPVVVFDATGNPGSMERAFSLVAHGGRLVFVGLVQADITFHDPELHRRELTLLASRNAQAEDFARVLQAVESGTIDVTPWMTHRAALSDVPGVFETWTRSETGVVKALIELG